MNEAYIINTIQNYIDNHIITPSYSLWAADEIMNRVIEELSKLPPHITGVEPISHIEIIEEFIREMDYLYETSITTKNKLIFMEARSTGKEILRMFL